MALSMKAQVKDKQRSDIRMLQIKKLQDANKFLKADNTKLTTENGILTNQCSGLKQMMISYEREAIYQRVESNVSL